MVAIPQNSFLAKPLYAMSVNHNRLRWRVRLATRERFQCTFDESLGLTIRCFGGADLVSRNRSSAYNSNNPPSQKSRLLRYEQPAAESEVKCLKNRLLSAFVVLLLSLAVTACGSGSSVSQFSPESSTIASVSPACTPSAVAPSATSQCNATVQARDRDRRDHPDRARVRRRAGVPR